VVGGIEVPSPIFSVFSLKLREFAIETNIGLNEVASPPENFPSKRIGNPMSFRAGKFSSGEQFGWRNLQGFGTV
jgi:hypothetical protein